MYRHGRSPFGACLVGLSITALIAAAPLLAQGRPITDRDLYAFRWVADPQISPDGSEVAYTLVQVNERENRYETEIWLVSTDGHAAPRRLTVGPRDGAPRWAPNGHSLAFARATDDTSRITALPAVTGGRRAPEAD